MIKWFEGLPGWIASKAAYVVSWWLDHPIGLVFLLIVAGAVYLGILRLGILREDRREQRNNRGRYGS